ncbi:MAG: DUF1289 domain-containing protein [Planctomycetota bacterium]
MFRDRPRRYEKPPSTPCVKVCKFTAGGDYCLGCRRTRDEIARWWDLSEEERQRLLRELQERRR